MTTSHLEFDSVYRERLMVADSARSVGQNPKILQNNAISRIPMQLNWTYPD